MSPRAILTVLFPVERGRGAGELLLGVADYLVALAWWGRHTARHYVDRAIAASRAIEPWFSRAALALGAGLPAMMAIRIAAAWWAGRL